MSTTGRVQGGGSLAPTRQQLDELDALLKRMLALPVAPPPEPVAEPIPPSAPAMRMAAHLEATPIPERPARAYPAPYLPDEEDQGRQDPFESTELSRSLEPPVPGGRHDLVEDVPADPVQELARRRLEEQPHEAPPFQSTWQPSAQTWGPLAETWRQARPVADEAAPVPARARPAVFPPIPAASGPSVQTETVEVQEYPPDSIPEPAPAVAPIPAPTPPAPEKKPSQPRSPLPPVSLWPLIAFNAAFDVLLLPLGPVGAWLRRPSGGGLLAGTGLLCLLAAALLLAADWYGWSF
jgi:hypothetical protein